jgi:hypothetical protein
VAEPRSSSVVNWLHCFLAAQAKRMLEILKNLYKYMYLTTQFQTDYTWLLCWLRHWRQPVSTQPPSGGLS